MFGRNFYISLGNLIYAVYYGDLIYKNMNSKDLFKNIKRYITPNEEINDEYGTNNSFYCIFEIERLIDENADPYLCFSIFESYYTANIRNFNRRIQLEIEDLIGAMETQIPESHQKTFAKKYKELSRTIGIQ